MAWHHGLELPFKSLQNNKPWWSNANQKFTSAGFLQFTHTPSPAGELAFQKPEWIVPVGKALVLNSKSKRGGSKMTLQGQLRESDKAARIKHKWYLGSLPRCESQISFIKFWIRKMSNQQSTLELTFEFSCLGFTPKEVDISEKTGIIFPPIESST